MYTVHYGGKGVGLKTRKFATEQEAREFCTQVHSFGGQWARVISPGK